MAQIEPFRGVRYTTADLDKVTAPPYDVISPAEQDALYERHPQNVVRLILNRDTDRYASAARCWHEWTTSGTLAPDHASSLYVYRQTFADPQTGEPLPERVGLMCLLRLSPYGTGQVYPHEHTLPKHKADRLELTRAAQAQFESIYGLYTDPDRAVQSFLGEYDDREPVMETLPDAIGSSHSVERIADENAIAVVQEMLADKAVFIADGHHRYETALNFQREWRDAHPEVPADVPVPADFILITLTAFEDEGLLVLPTHRLVKNVDSSTLAALPQTLASAFVVEEAVSAPEEAPPAPNSGRGGQGSTPPLSGVGGSLPSSVSFTMILPGKTYTLTLKPELMPDASAPAVRRLAVSLLQELVLTNALGISAADVAAGEKVAYTRDADEARDKVKTGECGVAFLLPRPTVTEVRDVSLVGDVMPQKSTYFYPKLLSGLVLRDLRPGTGGD